MSGRDDFSKPVKRQLADRVRHACSNPDCENPTLGPDSDEEKTINIGVAAYITAAASGGMRDIISALGHASSAESEKILGQLAEQDRRFLSEYDWLAARTLPQLKYCWNLSAMTLSSINGGVLTRVV